MDGLRVAVLSLFHNVVSLDFYSIDLTHTAHGVHDEAQAGCWGDVQQPRE